MTLDDVAKFMETHLGDYESSTFTSLLNEFFYGVRCMALTTMVPEAEARQNFKEGALAMLGECAKIHAQRICGKPGILGDLNVSSTGIYDGNMNPIKSLKVLKENQEEIIEVIVEAAVKEYNRGRKIAKDIVARMKVEKKEYKPKTVRVTLSSIDKEIKQIEEKLPNVTVQEGKRLAELYDLAGRMRPCDGSS